MELQFNQTIDSSDLLDFCDTWSVDVEEGNSTNSFVFYINNEDEDEFFDTLEEVYGEFTYC